MSESTYTERRESETTVDPMTGEQKTVETYTSTSEHPDPVIEAPAVVVAEPSNDLIQDIRAELRAVRDDLVSLAERMEERLTANNTGEQGGSGAPTAATDSGTSPANPAPISTAPEPTAAPASTEVAPPAEEPPKGESTEEAPRGKRRPGWLF